MPRRLLRGRTRYRPERFDPGEPIRHMSLVPLAGVIVIIAALLASTYRPPTRALLVQLPIPHYPGEVGVLSPPQNRVVINANDVILFNGTPVTDAHFAQILAQAPGWEPGTALLFTPERSANFGRVMEVLGIIHRAGLVDSCFRFSGISRYRHFERPETFDDLPPYSHEDCDPIAGWTD